MATKDQLAKSIEPGSIPYGDRQTLEQGLPGTSGTTPPVPAAAAGGATPGGGGLQSLLSGDIAIPDDGSSLTSGLSVGGGDGGPGSIPNPQRERLLIVAQGAKSPSLRAAARLALLRLEQGPL